MTPTNKKIRKPKRISILYPEDVTQKDISDLAGKAARDLLKDIFPSKNRPESKRFKSG